MSLSMSSILAWARILPLCFQALIFVPDYRGLLGSCKHSSR